MQANTVEDVEAQDRMLREANEKIDRLKCAADFLIAAEFTPGSAADKRAARDDAAIKVALHFNDSDLPTFRREAQKALNGQVTFHWPLEFPEVMVERGGFDGFVGNPPFMGGLKITEHFGREYRLFLVNSIAGGANATADICGYFFLRASAALRSDGHFGMLATNSIAQGDTREVGLDRLLATGSSVVRAIPSLVWPGTANVYIAQVWVRKGGWDGPCILSGTPVSRIGAYLLSEDVAAANPYRLASNAKLAFQGSNVLGMGFTMSPDEAQTLISLEPKNKEVVFPLLNGEDLNSRPDQSASRFAIYFRDWPLTHGKADNQYDGPTASDYPDCLAIVEAKVKPERASNNDKRRREIWWQFTRPTTDLYAAIAELERVIVIAATSRTLAFAFVPSKQLFSHATYVFASGSPAMFAILQSAPHEAWARKYASSMKGDLRYTPTDCFETFPLLPLSGVNDLAGEAYHEHRCSLMAHRKEGLTKTYNRFHDPNETSADIQKLRQLHVEMDNAVAAAYGWADLDLDHGFHPTKQGVRYTISEPARRDVLARLLKLNHERYAEELKQGLHEKKKPKATKGKRKPQSADVQMLFGEDDFA
jgi:hypothetical protein